MQVFNLWTKQQLKYYQLPNNMKNLIITAVLAVALVGCSSIPIATEQSVVTQAAQLGTATALLSDPQYLPDFVAGAQVLASISNSTNVVTVTSVEGALATGGVTNPIVSLAITDAINDADSFITSNNNSVTVIKEVCGWISTGIAQSTALQAGNRLALPKKQ